MINEKRILQVLPDMVNANERLVWRGRHVIAVVLLQVGEKEYLFDIRQGNIERMRRGPFVMPTWDFALRAEEDTWERFWLAVPPPGFHDLFALIKNRRLRIEGNLYPFMSNLLYFKDLMASIRVGVDGGEE